MLFHQSDKEKYCQVFNVKKTQYKKSNYVLKRQFFWIVSGKRAYKINFVSKMTSWTMYDFDINHNNTKVQLHLRQDKDCN